MALWTITDIATLGEADGSETVRVRLWDGSSVDDRELSFAQAADLRSRIEDLLASEPDAKSIEADIGGVIYEIDLADAEPLLAGLPAIQPPSVDEVLTQDDVPEEVPTQDDVPEEGVSEAPPPLEPPPEQAKAGISGKAATSPVAIALILALLVAWGTTYLVMRSALHAADVEMAGQMIQNPRTDRDRLDWAMHLLATDGDVPMSPERRKQMVELLASHPETSLQTMITIYGTEFPEFRQIAVANDLPAGEAISGQGDTAGPGSTGETHKPVEEPQATETGGKQIFDRIPEQKPGVSPGQPASPEQVGSTSPAVYPPKPGQLITKQPGRAGEATSNPATSGKSSSE